MDPISFLLLFLIVALGGVVAFLADRLGRKLGKKRLSLRGLRPRHTAEVLTVAAGMVIPLFTILVLLALSSGIREWALQGPAGVKKLNDNIRNLEARQKQLQGSIADLEESNRKGVRTLISVRAQTKELTRQRDAIRVQRDTIRTESDRLKGKVASLNGELGHLNAKLGSITIDLRTSRASLTKVQGSYKVVLDEYNQTTKSKNELDVSFKELSKQIKEQYAEADRLRNDIDALQSQVTSLTQSKTDLDSQLVTAKHDLERYQKDLTSVKLDLEEKQQQVDRLVAQQEQLKNAFDTSLLNTRFARLVTPAGSELSRVALSPQETPIAARAALQNLLTQSSKTADVLGAKPSKPGELSAMLRDLPLANGKKISADEQVAAIVKAVANLPEESVLVAYSYWNVYEGESVPLQIRPFRNPVVYRAGQLIAELRIDGQLPDDQLIGQIKDGLLMSVRLRARKDRMIPAGSDESFGAVTIEQLSALVRDLKAENRRVRLQAVAKNDTRAADQLQLLFKIKY